MYHWIVRRKLTAAFAAIARGDYAAIVRQFAPVHRHVFHGDHALGGARTSLTTTRAWYERLARVFPDLVFEVASISVEGFPWSTRAIVEWRDAFTLPDGARGSNQGIHVFELAWGKVRRLEIHCDTARLQGYLARIGAGGVPDATLPPIVG
jgi:ketosteroid isomerase-like protein